MSNLEYVPAPTIEAGDISEQVRQDFVLTPDPHDQLILEVAREVDRHQTILAAGELVTPKEKSQISKRRADIVVRLHELLVERRERQRGQVSVQKVAVKVLQVVRETLNKNLGREHGEVLLDDIVSRLSRTERKAGPNGVMKAG